MARNRIQFYLIHTFNSLIMKRLFLLSILIVGMLTSFPAKAISTYPNAHLTAIQIDSLPSEAQRVRYKEILEHEASGLVDAHTLQIRNSTLEWLEAQGLLGSPRRGAFGVGFA